MRRTEGGHRPERGKAGRMTTFSRSGGESRSPECAQHGRYLRGGSPRTAFEREEGLDRGKGVRRKLVLLPSSTGITVERSPMRNLKEARVKLLG